MLAGPPGLLCSTGPDDASRVPPSYFRHLRHNPPYADALCFSIVCSRFFFFCFSPPSSVFYEYLPQLWTASNSAWQIKRNVSAFINNPTEHQKCMWFCGSIKHLIIVSLCCTKSEILRVALDFWICVGSTSHLVESRKFNFGLYWGFFSLSFLLPPPLFQLCAKEDGHSWPDIRLDCA